MQNYLLQIPGGMIFFHDVAHGSYFWADVLHDDSPAKKRERYLAMRNAFEVGDDCHHRRYLGPVVAPRTKPR